MQFFSVQVSTLIQSPPPMNGSPIERNQPSGFIVGVSECRNKFRDQPLLNSWTLSSLYNLFSLNHQLISQHTFQLWTFASLNSPMCGLLPAPHLWVTKWSTQCMSLNLVLKILRFTCQWFYFSLRGHSRQGEGKLEGFIRPIYLR